MLRLVTMARVLPPGQPVRSAQGCSLRLSEACLKAQRVVDQSHEVEARRRLAASAGMAPRARPSTRIMPAGRQGAQPLA